MGNRNTSTPATYCCFPRERFKDWFPFFTCLPNRNIYSCLFTESYRIEGKAMKQLGKGGHAVQGPRTQHSPGRLLRLWLSSPVGECPIAQHHHDESTLLPSWTCKSTYHLCCSANWWGQQPWWALHAIKTFKATTYINFQTYSKIRTDNECACHLMS